jgi:hypothetical protein
MTRLEAPAGTLAPVVGGAVTVERDRLLRFPAYRLVATGLEVRLGRYSALSIYFGRGQRIDLPGDIRWRLVAIERGSHLCPVVVDRARGRLAVAAASAGSYGINGRDYAYTLNPAEAGWGRPRCWDLWSGEGTQARLTRHPFVAECLGPVPLPALLLALLLTRFGIPGEGERFLPEMHWG